MSEFRATREMARALDTRGFLQLPSSETPSPDFLSCLETAQSSGSRGYLRFNEFCSYGFYNVIKQICLYGTGLEPSLLSSEIMKRQERGFGVHRDKFGQILTLAWMPDSPGIKDQLHFYGRGLHHPGIDDLRATIQYRNGPVLIAGAGFGENLGYGHTARGATWHRGSGELGTSFIALDFVM